MKISIIYPICGMPVPENPGGQPHPFLLSTLNSITFNGYKNYEILIGIDGERPWLASYLTWWSKTNGISKDKLKIFTYPFSKTFGNLQRNKLIKEATGDVLCFLDQDDSFNKGALSSIANAAKKNPGHPLIFKMAVYMFGNNSSPANKPKILWDSKHKEIAHAAIGGHMIVVPNKKELIGKWPHDKYEADFHFIKETCDAFSEKGFSPIWINFIISNVRPWSQYISHYTEELKPHYLDQAQILLKKEIDELKKEIDELKKEIDELKKEIDELMQNLERKDAIINKILQSTSWKITKPLRFAGQLLRKLNGRKNISR